MVARQYNLNSLTILQTFTFIVTMFGKLELYIYIQLGICVVFFFFKFIDNNTRLVL